MQLRITKEAPWTIGERQRVFKVGEEIEAGKDIPDSVAQDMLEHGYAEPATTKSTIIKEDKKVEPSETKVAEKKPRGRRKAAKEENDE